MDWPSLLPDLNPIENLWSLLVRRVYADFHQFDDVESLIDAICEAWDSFTIDKLKRLLDAMPSRIGAVLPSKDAQNKY